MGNRVLEMLARWRAGLANQPPPPLPASTQPSELDELREKLARVERQVVQVTRDRSLLDDELRALDAKVQTAYAPHPLVAWETATNAWVNEEIARLGCPDLDRRARDDNYDVPLWMDVDTAISRYWPPTLETLPRYGENNFDCDDFALAFVYFVSTRLRLNCAGLGWDYSAEDRQGFRIPHVYNLVLTNTCAHLYEPNPIVPPSGWVKPGQGYHKLERALLIL